MRESLYDVIEKLISYQEKAMQQERKRKLHL
jgi:hypothetical protein